MQYTRLGRSGLQVSRLCLGTMNFGPLTSESDSHAIMDRAVDLGINVKPFSAGRASGRDPHRRLPGLPLPASGAPPGP
jgi:hypothetical protein